MGNIEFIEAKDKLARRLVVTFHGFGGPSRMRRVVDVVHNDMNDTDIFAPDLRFSLLGTKHPSILAKGIIDKIDDYCSKANYEDILFISYSAGATIARKVLIGAWGQNNEVPFEREFNPKVKASRNWHKKVSRLVNIAGMTRGWIASSRQKLKESIGLNLFGLLGHIIPGYMPTIFRLRRGAPFIINMRLQWLALMNTNIKDRPKIAIINLLGSVDNLVGPLEIIDFTGDFADSFHLFFIQVPSSDHRSILDVQTYNPVNLIKNWERTKAKVLLNTRRGDLLRTAIVGKIEGLPVPVKPFHNPSTVSVIKESMSHNHLDDNLPSSPNTDIKHLVFVIHGIRDDGYWTKKIAAKIKARGKNSNNTYASNTKSYGYYTALPFALPWIRRQKVEWLMDEYATTRAFYPNAKFSYVGHSNGTYLAANALENYETCIFDKIVFAGSVVRKDYNWENKFSSQPPKVKKLLNYVATNDLVVALFPKGLQPLKVFDLGSAGHDGFSQLDNNIQQIKYVEGGHGAGVKESRWDEISDFIVNDVIPKGNTLLDSDFKNSRSPVAMAIGGFSTIILIFLLYIIGSIGWALFSPLIDHTWAAAFDLKYLNDLWSSYVSKGKELNVTVSILYVMMIRYFLYKY
ncbi:MAG: hypothetical protein JKY19_09015 [Alcanivoracaceae bacterium]|nr:hypothetical protein [Alcanivoracaceae bacterium]